MRNNSLATYCRWIGRSICLAVATGNSPYSPFPLSLSDLWQQSFQWQANAADCSTWRGCCVVDTFNNNYYHVPLKKKSAFFFLSFLESWRVIGVTDQARIRVTEALVLNICGTSVDCVNVSSVPVGHLQLSWCLSPTFSSLGCWLVLLSLHVFSYLACNFLRCGKKIYMFSVYFMLDPWLKNESSRYKAVLLGVRSTLIIFRFQ